jgi:peptide/nickel transport system ATP-binding protein
MTKISKQFFTDEAKALESADMVGLNRSLLNRFPSELSGGQLQRVIIAMALAKDPKLILLDEPTTALDFETKEKIIELLESLRKNMGFEMLFVTHELYLAKRLCNECAVLQNGRIVERGKSEDIFEKPKHIYTKSLIEAGFDKREFRK